MKQLAFIVFLLTTLGSSAQKYDYRWIMGFRQLGNFNILFTDTSADTISTGWEADMLNSQTTVSDSTGNLLFYSNGAHVYNRLDSIMLNGDSINYGLWWDQDVGADDGGGYYWLEDIVGLPTDLPNIWNVIHCYVEFNTNSDLLLYPWRIDETRVDMNGDSGLGEVVFKNKTIIQDTLGSYVTACKHANGRDWWVLASKTSTNCLYELLIQPDTVIQYPMQCLGSMYHGGDAGQAAFSPDGTRFAWVGTPGEVNMYDFDRCSGTLSNAVHLPIYPDYVDSGYLQYGLAFSPNSRFMYIAQTGYILQFDLQSTDIMNSVDTVGRYYRSHDSLSLPGTFFLMQLAPDGKIYVSATNGIKYLHVINNPDQKGDSCNFVNYGFPLPHSNSFGLPSFPNYRLGRLIGSECDTIYSDIRHQTPDERQLKIFPNPAKDYTIIDYGYTDWSRGGVSMEIINELGQMVHSQQLPMYSGFQKMDVSQYTGGTYMVYIKRANEIVATDKFIKQ
ncbi:MAG TPA: T9SS type A sorting domain-containing protein [Chitinophagales bacterium]|nr:T9SS type A sorting domain-containing protein [Chitinophagales bacterium]